MLRVFKPFFGLIVAITIGLVPASLAQAPLSQAPAAPTSADNSGASVELKPTQSAKPAELKAQPEAHSKDAAQPAELVVALPIATGDELDVSVYNLPEMTSHQRVNEDGDIHLPYVQYVHVAGLTNHQAEDQIAARLSNGGFMRKPEVTVFVKEYGTAGVAVLGEVAHPGIYPAMGARHLWDLNLAAGGVTERAGRQVTIRHHDAAQPPATVTISNQPDEALQSNVEIVPGDTVVVARAGVVYVLGEVNQSAAYLMDTGDTITVLQALAKAHGPTNNAALGKARLLRKTPAGLQELPVNLKEVLSAKTGDVNMRSEDILFIPGSKGKYAAQSTFNTILSIATGVAIRGY